MEPAQPVLADDEEVIARRVQRMIDARPTGERLPIGGSPPAELPQHVIDTAAAALKRRGYADAQGDPQLREAVAERLISEGIEASPDRVLVTNGAMQALDVCFRTLLGPGAAVVMPLPGFFISGMVRRAGGVLRGFRSPAARGYQPDWSSASEAIDERTRILFVNSPVNPTGYVYGPEDLEQAARLARRHDLWVISDESYSHFVYGGHRHESVCTLAEAAGRTMLVRSFSKDYVMPGWRLGYVLMPPALVAPLRNMFEWSSLCVNHVSQAAGLAALTGPQGWVKACVEEAEERSAWVSDAINSIRRMHTVRPEGGMNLLVEVGDDVDLVVSRLVRDAGVPVQPGPAFGAPGCFRFQFGARDDTLRQALDRIRDIAKEL